MQYFVMPLSNEIHLGNALDYPTCAGYSKIRMMMNKFSIFVTNPHARQLLNYQRIPYIRVFLRAHPDIQKRLKLNQLPGIGRIT